jgi:outer membrane protein OmpA-like peptidoglycan-associated protein
MGATGEIGAAGTVCYWDLYEEFNFSSDETSLSAGDLERISEIAAYMKENPSLRIGIDGTAVSSRDQDINDLRVNAIRDALINAGVSSGKITTGAIGGRDLRRKGRIAVLYTTG